ncbi:MAG: acyl-ACP--UDP-N-acetylglucosamine O-acyltransferase [Synergistaceae bacterium]|jgi:UDP-N-acetylglucosamine acyltransferase|nr:acyl-ACP--UDP-N-acetylglucosamine O-acyltransferase [Synergistaceae bacterium]
MPDGVFIHPTATVAGDAVLGEGVKIGPYCVVDPGAKLGDGTVLECFVRIKRFVEIGRRCHIYENVVLGGVPQDSNFGGETSYVRICDGVTLRENVTVHRATGEGRETFVGEGSILMEGCHIGHNVRVGRRCTLTNKVGLSGHVQMGDCVVAGGMSGFHQFVRVGSYAMIGGLSKVTRDVPPYALADGNPAVLHGLNVVGLRRQGFTQEQRSRIKTIYRTLFDPGYSRRECAARVNDLFSGDEFASEILAFVRSGRRGVIPWGRAARGESQADRR